MDDIEYTYSDGVTDDFAALASALDREFTEKNGAAQEQYNQYNKLSGIKDVIVAYAGGQPVACASIKKFDEFRYEIKRVYVEKEFRKLGLAKTMMLKLEEIALGYGAKALVLETSRTFAPAVSLYRGLGYAVIENYGQYKGMSLSLCMEKNIGPRR